MKFLLPTAALTAAVLFAPAADPVLLDHETDKAYRAGVPRSSDGRLRKLAEDPKTLFYDEKAMPPAFQFWQDAAFGVVRVSYNVSATKPVEPFGNANREFPWDVTAGIGDHTNVRTYKFIRLPVPVEVWRQYMADDPRERRRQTPQPREPLPAYRWEFPGGTVVGEVLQIWDPAGEWRTFETRLRTKKDGVWRPEVYKPFEVTVDRAAMPGPFRKLADRLQPGGRRWMEDRRHPVPAFTLNEADEYILPDLTPAEVRAVLASEFKPVRGTAGGANVTSQTDFNIVPKEYTGGTIAVTHKSCMQCHDTVFRPATAFEMNRDWYGRVRGDDGIFSWHPFGPVGTHGDPGLNPKLLAAGLVKPWKSK